MKRRQASSMLDGRSTARILDGMRVEFTNTRCGHVHIVDYSKKKRNVKGYIPQAMLPFMVRYWSSNGCIVICPTCEKNRKKR